MGAMRRGLRNPFRNVVRTAVAVLLLALVVGLLALMVQAALLSRREFGRLEARVRTLIELREAGAFGTGGFGGDKPIGEADFSVETLEKVKRILHARHIVRIEEYLYTPQIDPSRENAYAMIIGLRPDSALRAIGEIDYEHARLIAGRALGADDTDQRVAVVGTLYAKQRLGLAEPTDPALAGREVVLNGQAFRVIGVYMSPTAGHNFAMHVGLNVGDAKRLESHGEAGNPRIIAGRDFTPEDAGTDVALIGQGYARWAGIAPESLPAPFVIDLTRTHPVIFALDRPKHEVTIIGIYASGYVFGDMQLFMPLETFRRISGVERGLSWLFVTADSVDHVAFVARKLREALGDVADIIAPKSAAAFTSATTRTVDRIAGTVSLFAMLLMAVVVFFVMLVTVRERAREIGTLKAIGGSDGGIAVQLLAEAIGLSLIGGVLGMALFRAAGALVAGRLFALSMAPFLPPQYKDTLFESLGGIGFGIAPATIGFVLGIALLVAAVGSGYGVWQVTRLSPVEAMKHE